MKRPKRPDGERAKAKTARDRDLTADEARLWEQVAASVDTSSQGKMRVRRGGEAATSAPTPPREHSREPTTHHRLSAPPPLPEAARPARKTKPPVLAEFDRRKVRHIARGKTEIDARLDLHGLRQSEARYRLIGFLHAAQGRGHRTVLVITGKGGSSAVDPLAHALGEPQRGVLRRLVPQWLQEPEIRAFVVSFTTASVRHGGDGALYVHLRRGDR